MGTLDRIKSEFAYLRGGLAILHAASGVMRAPDRTVGDALAEAAARHGDRPVIASASGAYTFRELDARANAYARLARDLGVGRGDCVALLAPNSHDYLAAWIGVARAGGATALLNTGLLGGSLAHCVNIVKPKAVIVDPTLLAGYEGARALLPSDLRAFVTGSASAPAGFGSLETELTRVGSAPLGAAEKPALTIADRCLYIYTSGTTGLPKAANLYHGRVLRIAAGFAAAMAVTPADRMFVALPMYHATGGVIGALAPLMRGGSAFVVEKFSAREFFPEIARQDCSLFVYIGELARFLVATAPGPADRAHRLRLCCGNGLRPDVWPAFVERFRPGKVLEFYGATEGNLVFLNFDSRPGAVGRIPKWAERRYRVELVKFDVTAGKPVRDAAGRCVRCPPGEVGEAISEILDDPGKPVNKFDGYADAAETEKKVLHGAFVDGDAWFRSGDLMKRDAQGYYYFVDRIGDTFRWKGQNVATTEVGETISTFPGVREVTVYGVAVPGQDGKAGMAAIVADDPTTFDRAGLRAFLAERLPDYARPLFLRFPDHLDVTGTFKQRKVELAAEGYDLAKVADALFLDDRGAGVYVPFDAALATRLAAGAVRT
ncbi:MAG: long-chain-acyl-CoA synthetase [Hyphomicrobiales bacterium]|nr:long-chain-acyl-CoA synthetase [Hyphomicrobiales bacterium]MDE2016867.1 long-chain-acyl-CoA synthetase [Hyphomicrobiales bacterium]